MSSFRRARLSELSHMRIPLSLVLSVFGVFTGFQALPAQSTLSLSILSGQGATNDLVKGKIQAPIIEVRQGDQPVTGALVTIVGTDTGPGVVFVDGERTKSFVTGGDGRVSIKQWQPVGSGAFTLNVTARYGDQFASSQLTQINEGRETSRLSRRSVYIIVAAVVVAAAVVIAVALTHKGSKGTTVSPGTPTVGSPQ